jgi:hypothetical protein
MRFSVLVLVALALVVGQCVDASTNVTSGEYETSYYHPSQTNTTASPSQAPTLATSSPSMHTAAYCQKACRAKLDSISFKQLFRDCLLLLHPQAEYQFVEGCSCGAVRAICRDYEHKQGRRNLVTVAKKKKPVQRKKRPVTVHPRG